MGHDFKDYEKELGRPKAGVVSGYSPDEIREIVADLRSTLQRLGEQGVLSGIILMCDITMKIEELTQIMIGKSGWDRRFKVGGGRQSPPHSRKWSRVKSS